jgi:hypothetical protein
LHLALPQGGVSNRTPAFPTHPVIRSAPRIAASLRPVC